jgi:hypothetical protein
MKAGSRWPLVAPAAALIALHLAVTAGLLAATGGHEISDDASHLLRFVREPFVLWRDPGVTGLSGTWASFPPLLPPLFGALVRPWLWLAPEPVALRLGALLWTLLALLGTGWLALRLGGTAEEARRAGWLYVAVPLPVLASAVLPQEESYVSLFAVAAVGAAAAGRLGLAAALLAATALAGKVLLLLLAVPLALAGPRPLRSLVALGGVGATGLAAYLGFHALAHGQLPLLGYRLDPIQGVSLASLLRLLGAELPAATPLLSSLLAGAAALGWCALGRRRGLDLLPLVAGTLWIAQLLLAVAMPPYLLWNLPFLAVLLARRGDRAGLAAAGLVAWVGAAYGAKLSRAVALGLEAPRGAGKSALTRLATGTLGPEFPYHAAQTLLTALCLAIGAAFLAGLLARGAGGAAGARTGKRALRGGESSPQHRGGGHTGHASGAR